MKQSQLFTKTKKDIGEEEKSRNAQLLIRAGYVFKEMAGVYSYLPLGLRVIKKIKNIIREELNAVGCQEMKMTFLQNPEIWQKTGRWDDKVVDNWFKTKLKNNKELGLAFTHEEPIANIMSNYVSSYRDLPFYAYQFQTKFRNELRAKSGIMRGREFLMKDLYSFCIDKKQHNQFYEKMKDVYMKIFTRLGIGDNTYITMSDGAPFSKYSYEFQTLTPAGEDIIMYDKEKKIAINKADYTEQIFEDFGFKKDEFNFQEGTSSEVGDIYTLGTKYSEPLGLKYTDENGKEHPVFMGSYGIGVNRNMGTIVEVHNDEKGIIWPLSAAPFQVHLMHLGTDKKVAQTAEKVYNDLTKAGIEVLYDDRQESAGVKLNDADLIGIPYRLVISEKTLKEKSIEIKKRNSQDSQLIKIDQIIKYLQGELK